MSRENGNRIKKEIRPRKYRTSDIIACVREYEMSGEDELSEDGCRGELGASRDGGGEAVLRERRKMRNARTETRRERVVVYTTGVYKGGGHI
jgi:hypothetical protein